MKNTVVIYGGGGHAKVVKECLDAQQLIIKGFVDDDPSATLFNLAHLGKYHDVVNSNCQWLVAVGNNSTRKKIVESIRVSFTKAIHPSSTLSPTVKLGVGSAVFHRSVIQADTNIGDHVIVNTSSQIDHDCSVKDFVHVGPGAILCGTVTVGEGTLIGAGAIVLPGIKIGKWTTIGAGAVVIEDVPDEVLVTGIPGMIRHR
jgi:sugar O-acyltransferase (sialic acid O-acetyltransferase NeuD family)